MNKLTLNLVQGAVSFNFSEDAARQLYAEIATLMQSLKAAANVATGGRSRPAPQKPMEYRHTGDVFLEIFCNPNIYPSPFAAKILITLRDDLIRLTSEAELTQLIEDINTFLEN
ncbi:MAG: hypothetical protein AAGE96_04915 [Cyanobacteria bacterium P01_G01_bin.19]